MSDVVIRVENLSKEYRLGTISGRTLHEDLARRWAKWRGKPDPSLKIGQVDHGNRSGEQIWALKDVSFEVKQGEVLGIIGRNGAGKSTLLKILSRVTAPSAGEVKVKGRIASLLEVGTGFHPELTGRENIYLNGAILGMREHEIDRRFDEIVDFSGVEQFIDTPVKRYSSGMYVRLAFAVAAHLEPEILIVDEVLAVGDAEFQKRCLGKMGAAAKEGRTVLFVSHNMAAIKLLCSRAILLHGGYLADDGISLQVIGDYLGSGYASKAECVWNDPTKAPGNEIFRLHSVRIRDENGSIATKIDWRCSLNVEVEYWNLQAEVQLGATVILYTKDGTCVLSSISNHAAREDKQIRTKGLFRSTCRIPGNFLNEGQYTVTVLVFAEGYLSAHKEDQCIEFEIYDTGEFRGNYFGEWAGVVRPVLQWNTEKIQNRKQG